VIAQASRDGVLADVVAGAPAPARSCNPSRDGCRPQAVDRVRGGSSGTIQVDDGARSALLERGVSLLAAGCAT